MTPPALHARATHLYPGARGVATDGAGLLPNGPCRLDFADGVEVLATLSRLAAAGTRLDVPAHVTARGARIPAKAWLIEGDGATWRVRRRLDAA